jgi:type IV pilus assembly protein PilA
VPFGISPTPLPAHAISCCKESLVKRQQELRKNGKKGFTLVELIVVIVILGILAAIAIPALTGYITKAQDEGLKSEGRTAEIAAQTIASDLHNINLSATKPTVAQLGTAVGKTLTGTGTATAVNADWLEAISVLSATTFTGTVSIRYDANNKIEAFAYTKSTSLTANATKWAYYDGTSWEIAIPDSTSSPVTTPTIP